MHSRGKKRKVEQAAILCSRDEVVPLNSVNTAVSDQRGNIEGFCGHQVPLSRWAAVLLPEEGGSDEKGVLLCNAALAAGSSLSLKFGSRLSDAFDSTLPDPKSAHLSTALLRALCYFAERRLRLDGGEALLPSLFQTLSSAITKLFLLHPAGCEASTVVGATFEAAVLKATSKRQFPKGCLQTIFEFLVRHRCRRILLRLICHSPLTHDAAASVVCEGLDKRSDLREEVFDILSACMAHMPDAAGLEPATSVACLSFLQEVGLRNAALIAAGFESGIVHDSIDGSLQSLPGRQKIALQKSALTLLGNALEVLPRNVLDERSLQQTADLFLRRATDPEADLSSRAYALSEFTELILNFEIYSASAADKYVSSCESVLQLTASEGVASKQLLGRCIPAIVALIRRNPWELERNCSKQNVQDMLQVSGDHRVEGGNVTVDLAAFEASDTIIAPAHYESWLKIILDHFETLLDLASDTSVFNLLLNTRLGKQSFSRLCSAVLAVDAITSSSSSDTARLAEAEVRSTATETSARESSNSQSGPMMLKQLRLLLRTHVLGLEPLRAANESGLASHDKPSAQLACAATLLINAAANFSRVDCRRLLDNLSMSLEELHEMADAIFAETQRPSRVSCMGLKLLVCYAEVAPKAVMEVIPLKWLQDEIEKMLQEKECDKQPNEIQLMVQLLSALVHGGCICQSNLLWLTQQASELLLKGAVCATLDSIFAYPAKLARQVVRHTFDSLREWTSRSAGVGVTFMKALGHAAYLSANQVKAEVRKSVERNAALERPRQFACEDEYDYMLIESERDELEQVILQRTEEALEHDPLFASLAFVEQVATDGSVLTSIRAAAVNALSRFGMAHTAVAEKLVPLAVNLSKSELPTHIRCQAAILFGSLVVLVPATAEAHIPHILHSVLETYLDQHLNSPHTWLKHYTGIADNFETDPLDDLKTVETELGQSTETSQALEDSLKQNEDDLEQEQLVCCVHAILADLCSSRKLNAAIELPKLLPFLCHPTLGEATISLVIRVMRHVSNGYQVLPFAFNPVEKWTALLKRACTGQEGPLRWPRLLYLSIAQLCPLMLTEAFATMVPKLVPELLFSARQQELAQISEALCNQLSEAASHVAAGSDSLILHNMATLLAAWPTTDRGMLYLLKVLGGIEKSNASNDAEQKSMVSPLLFVAEKDSKLHGLLSLCVSRARTKSHSKSTVTDELTSLLAVKKRNLPLSSGAAAHGSSRKELASGSATVSAPEESLVEKQRIESRARQCLEILQSSNNLYTAAKLPELPKVELLLGRLSGSISTKKKKQVRVMGLSKMKSKE